VLFKPTTNAAHRTFIDFWGGMRPMKDAYFSEEDYCDPAAGSTADVGPQLDEQGLDSVPRNIGTCRTGEDQIQRPLMASFHLWYHLRKAWGC
jgi:hypothetical protein